MAKRKRRKNAADFDEEGEVLAEIAKALGEDPDDLEIEEESGLGSFGTDTFWLVTSGKRSWVVARDDDAAEDLAIAVVTQDLEDEPEIFTKSFIESHINMDRLKRDLYSDVLSSNEEWANDLDDDDLLDEAKRHGINVDKFIEEDEDGDIEITDKDSLAEEVAEQATADQLDDPMQYLEDIYGSEEAVERAIEIAGIDIKGAADDAVNTDGWAHFLARYDGNYEETPSGFVYWRQD